MPQIEVAFDIDANGIVHVNAKDMATQKEQSIKITASSGLSKEEVEELVKDAQAHSEEDKKRREAVEIRNQADTLIYGTEKNLQEHGDKISEEEKTKIQEAITAMKTAMEGDDIEAMKTAMQTLQTASHKLAEEMYKSASAEGTPPGAEDSDSNTGSESTSENGDQEKVVDAEFEEVDGEKK